jgi:hypothetical protein
VLKYKKVQGRFQEKEEDRQRQIDKQTDKIDVHKGRKRVRESRN